MGPNPPNIDPPSLLKLFVDAGAPKLKPVVDCWFAKEESVFDPKVFLINWTKSSSDFKSLTSFAYSAKHSWFWK